jgi:hypothetical protein
MKAQLASLIKHNLAAHYILYIGSSPVKRVFRFSFIFFYVRRPYISKLIFTELEEQNASYVAPKAILWKTIFSMINPMFSFCVT